MLTPPLRDGAFSVTTMTPDAVREMRRTDLQAAACKMFGKEASKWIGHATNDDLRQALTSGAVPSRFAANGNGGGVDLAAVIATAIALSSPRRSMRIAFGN